MAWLPGQIPPDKSPNTAGTVIPGQFNVKRDKPLDIQPVPPATRPRNLESRLHTDFNAVDQFGQQQDVAALLRAVLWNTDIDILLRTLGTAFTPRLVTVAPATTSRGTLIIPQNKYPRGYIVLNPAEISGFTNQVTFFPSLLRAGAAAPGNDFLSAAFNVSGVETARLFLDITAINGAPALRVDAQTQDPLTGNWATSQVGIFSGASTVGTFYASVGALGVDRNMRLLANVTGAATDITFSISGLFKGSVPAVVGSTVYLGGPDVNTIHGFPLLAGQKETFFLKENTALFGITATETLVLKVFQLQ